MSKGTAGEARAEWWFQAHGWKMFRQQPATKVAYVKGKPMIINCGKGGIADFTGYRMSGIGQPIYTAVEVKEAAPGASTLPQSRLSPDQRAWLDALPSGSAFVGVLWSNGNFEVFHFDPAARSYKKGEGAK
jgi:hypothetical protein